MCVCMHAQVALTSSESGSTSVGLSSHTLSLWGGVGVTFTQCLRDEFTLFVLFVLSRFSGCIFTCDGYKNVRITTCLLNICFLSSCEVYVCVHVSC